MQVAGRPRSGVWALALAVILILSAPVVGQVHDPRALEADPSAAQSPIAPNLTGLGDHHFPVTTSSPESQAFFDQGLRLTYAFNHSEALRAFKESVRLDANNAMAYWGWALVLGPNLNLPMVPDVVESAWTAIQKAVELAPQVSEKEQALIGALAARYTDDAEADRARLDQAYAEAMAEVFDRFPDDPDVATLYGAALMNISPWDYWTLDGSPKGPTPAAIEALSTAVQLDPQHPGALHYWIHLVEAVHPRRAEEAADNLLPLMPSAGHLVHMPSHIYMRVGRYADSYRANYDAVLADEDYISQCNAQGIYPLGYYPHNQHFLTWAAMFQGRKQAAMQAARATAQGMDGHGMLWGLHETFVAQPIYTMTRFGMWEEVLAEPPPASDLLFLNGAWRYARARAYTHQGNLRKAKRELKYLQSLQREVEAHDGYGVGFAPAGKLLQIAVEVASGELAAARGKTMEALSHLETAVRLEDGLLYNEPPDWYFPVRHILGAVLLEAGRPDEAEVVYSADLIRNPDNGYALYGLLKALRAQGKDSLAAEVADRFAAAWKDADVMLTSSRY